MAKENVIRVYGEYSFDRRLQAGNYHWINPTIREDLFPVEPNQFGEWKWRYFHFNMTMSTEKAIRAIRKASWIPAQSGHILAFGEMNPEEQWKYPIPALGSISDQHCILLHGGDGQRLLNMVSSRLGWGPFHRFLGVRR